jgi:hypothetical protein
LFRSAGEDLSPRRGKKKNRTRYNMVASVEEKKENERIGIVVFCCIIRFGGRVKPKKLSNKNVLLMD